MESASDTRNPISDLDIPILTLAALLGEVFSIDWILALTRKKASEVLAAMEEGIRQGILDHRRADRYAFKGPERQAECLSSFSEEEQVMLHREVADRIREEFPDEIDMLPIVIHQLMNTTCDLDDCLILFDAGDEFRRSYRQKEALLCYEKVIYDLKSIEGSGAVKLFVQTVLNYSRLFRSYDDPQWRIAVIKEAISRAEGTESQPFQALLKMHLAECELVRGREAAAVKAFDDGWSQAQEIENPDVKRSAVTYRMFFNFWQGRYRDVVEAFESIEPEVKRYPRSETALYANIALGASVAHGGKVAEGLGMLYGLYDHCLSIGDTINLLRVMHMIAIVLLEIEEVDGAMGILEEMETALHEKSDPALLVRFDLLRSDAFALKKDYDKAIEHAERALTEMGLSQWPAQLPILWKGDGFRRIPGYEPEQFVLHAVKSRNVFAKGLGYSLRAHLLRKSNRPAKEILRSLKLSAKWFKESGHEIQLAKTRLELAQIHLQTDNPARAREEVLKAHNVLAPIKPALIPEDLSSLLKGHLVKRDVQKEILSLAQEIVSIRDNRMLALRILTGINQLAGTERGGIFLLEGISSPPVIELRAEKNLREDQVAHPSFSPAMDMIRETISSGTGRIVKMNPDNTSLWLPKQLQDVIRSCFCVPMVLRGEIIGALYHDNRFFDTLVEETDLDLLSFLAGQAAIALDNAKAYSDIQQLNQQLVGEKQYYMDEDPKRARFKDFIGKSPAMERLFDQINRVANQETVVLIQGETGTGKELVARSIQSQSNRKEKPFISADCSALTETIINSELFGHEKGAFTGAYTRKIGRFELAHGGTFFLDEIGNIPMEVQVRLLRVLQTRSFQRVGGLQMIDSDFRLITATNKDLREEVASGRFREDLYYRLNVFPIIVPPLRERRDDIPLLALYFLGIFAAKIARPFDSIPKAQMEKLLEYPWPGNVRELQNVIERGVILSSRGQFRVPELTGHPAHSPETELMSMAEVERRHILRVLERTGGKIGGKRGAAQVLGLPYSTLYSRMQKLDITPAHSPTN